MGFFSFYKHKPLEEEIRTIQTLRGKEEIRNALDLNIRILIRKVEPFKTISGKYCIVKNKKTGKRYKLTDYRDPKAWGDDDDYEILTDWKYIYDNHEYQNEAAYVIPDDIREGEIVFVQDLIENFIGFTNNQGGSHRLKSCKAQWVNNDLKILYDPDRDMIQTVG